MNSVNFIGRLTANPELKQTASGVAYTRFTIAVQRAFKDKDGNRPSDFIDCIAWRGLGESIAKYFKKGNLIGVSGAMETNPYEDKNGNKRKAFTVNVGGMTFCDSGKSEDKDGAAVTTSVPKRRTPDEIKQQIESCDYAIFHTNRTGDVIQREFCRGLEKGLEWAEKKSDEEVLSRIAKLDEEIEYETRVKKNEMTASYASGEQSGLKWLMNN